MSELKETIERGDKVNIYFENCAGIWGAEVLDNPVATGDAWKLRTNDGGLVYVQNYSQMELIP
jgi:hypothetical protein